MSIEELKKKFIVDDDALKSRLEEIATKALQHCVLDRKGNVHFNNPKFTPREKLRLTLAARAIASQMDETLKSEVSVAELSANSGLPENQVRARAAELAKEKFVTSPKKGTYAAVPHKVEAMLDSVTKSSKK
jgi:riboflavin biosynthesis pyrimidine reductase